MRRPVPQVPRPGRLVLHQVPLALPVLHPVLRPVRPDGPVHQVLHPVRRQVRPDGLVRLLRVPEFPVARSLVPRKP